MKFEVLRQTFPNYIHTKVFDHFCNQSHINNKYILAKLIYLDTVHFTQDYFDMLFIFC